MQQPRRRAQKRTFDAILQIMADSQEVVGAEEVLVDKALGETNDTAPTRDVQNVRRATVNSAFSRVLRIAKPAMSSDADMLLWYTGDSRPWLNCAKVLYDDEKDSWVLIKGDNEFYWTLNKEAKLAAMKRWVEDPELLNEMALCVHAQLAAIEQEAKASFTNLQAQSLDK